MTVEIPEPLRLQAVNALRLPAEAVDAAWAEHCAWVDDKRPGDSYGGIAWQRYVRQVAGDLKALEEGKTREELRAAHRARDAKREAEAAAKANAEYAKFAVTFEEYVDSLREELFDENIPLPAHEELLAVRRLPRGVDPVAYLTSVFAAPPGSRQTSRVTACACGREVKSAGGWSHNVYRFARCEFCIRDAAKEHRLEKGEPPSVAQDTRR